MMPGIHNLCEACAPRFLDVPEAFAKSSPITRRLLRHHIIGYCETKHAAWHRRRQHRSGPLDWLVERDGSGAPTRIRFLTTPEMNGPREWVSGRPVRL